MKTSVQLPRNRNGFMFVTFVVIALVALFLGQISPVVASQATATATPAPIAIETLGTGIPSSTPGKAILLLRITLQPGAAFPAHVHPGALVIAVQSGEFAFTVLKGEADATRGIASGKPEAVEKLTSGQEAVFHVGDEIFEQEGVVHTARNAGAAPAVVLVAALVDPAKPFLEPMSASEMAGMATATP